jgi:glycosyltransferase involved in cell wall biosynthesis
MRILFQYYTGGGGGLENFVLLLKAYLRDFPGDHVTILCSEKSSLKNIKDFNNVNFILLKEDSFKEARRLWLGFFGLRYYARQVNADLVWSLNLGSYVRLAVPSVLSLNNAHQIYPREVTKFHPGGMLRVTLLRLFFRFSVHSADGVLVQTSLMGHYVTQKFGKMKAICVVPKAVEKSEDVVQQKLPSELLLKLGGANKSLGVNWLYVASFYPHKNHVVLIRAFLLLYKKGSNARLILTIKERDVIECGGEEAKILLEKGVIVALGWVSKGNLRELYANCDGCLMPSVLESLSSSHLEAMEWGLPQITSDLPYAHDLCGDAAIYVSPNSELEWVDAIEQLSKNDLLKEQMVSLGKNRIKSFPQSWGECARDVREFLFSRLAR